MGAKKSELDPGQVRGPGPTAWRGEDGAGPKAERPQVMGTSGGRGEATSGDILVVTAGGAPGINKWGAGMLLNVLRSTDGTPPKKDLTPDANSA